MLKTTTVFVLLFLTGLLIGAFVPAFFGAIKLNYVRYKSNNLSLYNMVKKIIKYIIIYFLILMTTVTGLSIVVESINQNSFALGNIIDQSFGIGAGIGFIGTIALLLVSYYRSKKQSIES